MLLRLQGTADKAAIQLVRHRLRRVDELTASRSAEVKSRHDNCSIQSCSDTKVLDVNLQSFAWRNSRLPRLPTGYKFSAVGAT
jgi:hypothetical protein